MTIARAQLVDTSVTRWYHCITRCVRRAFLLGEGDRDRKEWIENRLEELADIFAVAVGGFSVLDNHLHVLLRLDPDLAQAWSDEEIVRRWGRLFPPRDKSRQPTPVTEHWVQWRLKDSLWIATARQRLQSLSWFMKCLKEPLSRLANRQDKTRGTFFEARFKSVAVCDEEALLATSVYIDLNPVAAQVAQNPGNEQVYFDQTAPRARRGSRYDRSTGSSEGRQCCRLASSGWSGRFSVALSDRRPPRFGFDPRRHDARLLAGELCPNGRIHRATLSPRQSHDLGGIGRDLRAAELQSPKLAETDREAPRRTAAGSFLRDHAREASGNRRTARPAARGQPGGLSSAMTRSEMLQGPEVLPAR